METNPDRDSTLAGFEASNNSFDPFSQDLYFGSLDRSCVRVNKK